MNKIIIKDLEVFYHIGVPDEERAQPQRLLISIEMEYDFSDAAKTDDLTKTINYFAVAQRLLKLGDGRSWKLLEKLADDIATIATEEFHAESVEVKIKKFIIPEAQFIAVKLSR